MEKEKYMSRVLDSSKELKALQVSGHVWTRIQGQLTPAEQKISGLKLGLISLGVVVLFLLNFTILLQSKSNTKVNQDSANPTDMFSSSANNFYN